MSRDHAFYSGAYLLRGEDPEEFAALCEDYRRRFAAIGPETECLLTSLIHTEWNLRRYRKLERQMIELHRGRAASPLPPPELESRSFRQLRDHNAALNRSYQTILRYIQRLQESRQAAERKAEARKLGSFRKTTPAAPAPYLVTPPPPKTKPN